MSDCLFCKIRDGEIPADIVYSDEKVLAFSDINPAAPHHYVIIPREHIATINEASPDNSEIFGALFVAAAAIAQERGFSESGYRTVVNCNRDAGQEIFHVHMHLLAGKAMGWPPL